MIATNGIACWAWCLCERVCASGHTRTKAPPPPSESVPKLIQSARKRQSAGRAAATTAAAPLLFKRALRGRAINGRTKEKPRCQSGTRGARVTRIFPLSSQSYYSFFTSLLSFSSSDAARALSRRAANAKGAHTHTALPALPGCLRR